MMDDEWKVVVIVTVDGLSILGIRMSNEMVMGGCGSDGVSIDGNYL